MRKKNFLISGKMGSACITTKNGQGAFLLSEKTSNVHFYSLKRQVGCIFSSVKTGRLRFGQQKNGQGAAPS